jgi:hypothetical protein
MVFSQIVEPRKYFDKLQEKIGQTHSANRIEESPWREVVVRELNQLSYDYESLAKISSFTRGACISS